MKTRVKPIKPEVDPINKKYGKRIITVTRDMRGAQRAVIKLNSFRSILQLADEKELPIYLNKNLEEGRPVFFIVDGDYIYNYETVSRELARNTTIDSAMISAYAKS